MRAFGHLVYFSPEHIACLPAARPSDALHEAFRTDLCVSVVRAGLLAVLPGIAKSFLKPLFNARDLKCFQILERCQTVLSD